MSNTRPLTLITTPSLAKTPVKSKSRKPVPVRSLSLSPREKIEYKVVKLDVYKAYNDNPAMLLYNGEQQKGGIEKSMSSDPGSPVRVVVTAVKKTRKRRKYSDIEQKAFKRSNALRK